MDDASYDLAELRSRLDDQSDSLSGLAEPFDRKESSRDFFRGYVRLFVAGVEEGLSRHWPDQQGTEGRPRISLPGGIPREREYGITVAAFLPRKNLIVLPKYSVMLADVNLRMRGGDRCSAESLIAELTLGAGLEEAMHACQYRRDPEGLMRTHDRLGYRLTPYRMNTIELEAKDLKRRILDEIEGDYSGMIRQVAGSGLF